jgi:hypothetical protein
MTPLEVIASLYRSEINAGLQTDWDNGITVWLGGPTSTPGNCVLTQRTFGLHELSDIAAWLDDEARRLFPVSEYARNRFSPQRPNVFYTSKPC